MSDAFDSETRSASPSGATRSFQSAPTVCGVTRPAAVPSPSTSTRSSTMPAERTGASTASETRRRFQSAPAACSRPALVPVLSSSMSPGTASGTICSTRASTAESLQSSAVTSAMPAPSATDPLTLSTSTHARAAPVPSSSTSFSSAPASMMATLVLTERHWMAPSSSALVSASPFCTTSTSGRTPRSNAPPASYHAMPSGLLASCVSGGGASGVGLERPYPAMSPAAVPACRS
mmetsp:Transcript_23544/g.76612  ORF Transcript_23544/g.76612 Transcript_23544/m.76612 type:complete len:234 (+) Transcript_23544:1173-1874(+)